MKSILQCLENLEDDVGSLTEKVEDLSNAHDVHEKKCLNDNDEVQEKMSSMHSKVLEIRQLVGVTALSKGVATHKVISEMKRGSVVDPNGFMIPPDELIRKTEIRSQQNGEERLGSRSPRKTRSRSPTKSPTKPRKQGWEIRDEQRKAAIALKEQNTGTNGHIEDTSDKEDEVQERPRAARSKSRATLDSPRRRTRSPTKKIQPFQRMVSDDIESNAGSDESFKNTEETN